MDGLISELPNFADKNVVAWSSTVSKQAKDFNNARDDVGGEGWIGFHSLMVTLNTSKFEIPTQSMELFGEHRDDSGQQLMSTGNEQDVDKIVSFPSAHLGKKVEMKSAQKGGMSVKSLRT
ncbi:hypothetical protein K7X08_011215 [Anisodus acutangulus]|uniref:Uncharacterized protein n=1 Tax=Anisodus acutangulus TaxID=402998 RepID=A0A9Q1M141_9SOLA|nr:hypothetical protein K7X08_011215 [Anisodus acutangulus]